MFKWLMENSLCGVFGHKPLLPFVMGDPNDYPADCLRCGKTLVCQDGKWVPLSHVRKNNSLKEERDA
jgi:hypothetical protein